MPAPPPPDILDQLIEHGQPTARQREVAEAIKQHGTQQAAAEALGCVESNISAMMSALRSKAARAGWSPEHGLIEPYPDGYRMGKVTIQRDAGGAIERTWERMCEDRERQRQAFLEAIAALKDDVPKAKPQRAPRSTSADLAACYVLTDAHLGMLAWGEETRSADWDTDIAEQTIGLWMQAAIDAAPKTELGILAQLGDLLHHDGLESVTPTSGNVLDADTRFQRLVRIAVRTLRAAVTMMLKRHRQVHVILAEGNHDVASSVWLREVFAALYEREPRVTVDTSPDPYYCVEWGNTSIFFHHGHKARLQEVSRSFAGKFREIYGRTEYSYAHIGHLHHVAAKEDSLMIVEQHPTLAARDAHASRLGHVNQRGASVITYHRLHGEVGRTTIRPEMVRSTTDQECA